MSTEKKQRDFAERIPAPVQRRWGKIIKKYPRVTRRIHIVAGTGLSKPIIVRAMVDGMATEATLTKIDDFFTSVSELQKKDCEDAD